MSEFVSHDHGYGWSGVDVGAFLTVIGTGRFVMIMKWIY